MLHFMLDIETGSTKPNAVVPQVGCVAFLLNKNHLVGEHQWNLDVLKQTNRVYDQSTMDWWYKQPGETYIKVWKNGVLSPSEFCLDFADWFRETVREFADERDKHGNPMINVWGNAPSFDCVILKDMFNSVNLELPWKYWDERCYRTMKNMFPNVEKRSSTEHTALQDARDQARHLSDILYTIIGVTS